MNILILNSVGGWSGIGSHSLELALSLTKKGHNAIIGCSGEINVKYYAEKYKLPIKDIKLKNLLDIRSVLKIIKVCLREDVKVIVVNLGKEYWPATFVAKLLGLKIIVIRHQTNKLRKITNRLLAGHVDGIIAVSNAVRESLMSCGVPAGKIQVIHNAVNLDRFDPSSVDRNGVRRELCIDNDDMVIGTAGRLCREKGGLELLSAMHRLVQKYSSLKLMFVGDGPYKAELEETARSLSMTDKVIFTGFRYDMQRMYSAMDIFVLPSRCEEAFGIALIEAMAMKKPVIGADTGGIPEIISHGINGILVPPRNAGALSEAIAGYIENKEVFRDIASAGRKTVELKFSDKQYGDQFEVLLNLSDKERMQLRVLE
jgi:glycosyltransferase involved in cell wall biosynthesis